uniref:Uncharacterized protein n=1 Tax=Anguilla anguilla TaxID=7936 RepID=A0A0E9TIS4_ANGAN
MEQDFIPLKYFVFFVVSTSSTQNHSQRQDQLV